MITKTAKFNVEDYSGIKAELFIVDSKQAALFIGGSLYHLNAELTYRGVDLVASVEILDSEGQPVFECDAFRFDRHATWEAYDGSAMREGKTAFEAVIKIARLLGLL